MNALSNDVNDSILPLVAKAAEMDAVVEQFWMENAVACLSRLTAENRLEVFHKFCVHCGGANPSCQCWNDE